MSISLSSNFFESTRGRIVALLRPGGLTVDELCSKLELTDNAVRVQLSSMERDGLVRRGGTRRGATRPSQLYELTDEIAQLLSRAYIPFLTHLVHGMVEREHPDHVDAIMRDAGRALARELSPHAASEPFPQRVLAASDLLNAELGALTHVEKLDSTFRIVGHGCPLAALTGKHPSVCHAIESLLIDVIGVPVEECCTRKGNPRCCFNVKLPAT
jgi:predicted ArsR family transcriptional regulator